VGNGSTLALALDPRGKGVVGFGSDANGSLAVSAVRFDLDEGFSKTTDLVRSMHPVDLQALLAGFDAGGNALLAWIEYTGTYALWESRSPREGMWTGTQSIAPVRWSGLFHASLRPDGSGLIVWEDVPFQSPTLFARAVGPTGDETPVTFPFPPSGEASAVLLPNGGAWLATASVTTSLSVRRQSASGVWDDATVLQNRGVRNIGTTANVDGTAIVSFTDYVSASGLTHMDGFAQRYAASRWQPAQALDTRGDKGSTSVFGLKVAIDPDGSALAMWLTTMTKVVDENATVKRYETSYELRSQRFEPASGWTQTHEVLGSSSTSAPALALDDSGNGFGIWTERADLHARRYLAEGGWQATSHLYVGRSDPKQLAVADGGRAIVVWTTGSEIWAARFLEPEP